MVQNHTEECRKRLTKAIRESGDAGSKRAEAADNRIVEEILGRESEAPAEPMRSSSSGTRNTADQETPQAARKPGRPRKERARIAEKDEGEDQAKKRRIAEEEPQRGTTRPAEDEEEPTESKK